MSEPESRIHVLNNGRSPRNKGGDYITRDQAAILAQEVAISVAEYYMQQIPGLVAKMLGDALTAHGIELKPPPAVETPENPPTPAEGSEA